MRVGSADLRVEGRLVRIARLAAEGYEPFDDVEGLLTGLRQCGSRIDLFTFLQNIPDVEPRHDYLMELDNVAAVPVVTFDYWWSRQANDKVRNQVRRARRRGVTVREIAFDIDLVRGISAIYNESPIRQGRAFLHYGKTLDTVCRENATFLERSVFLGAFHARELIGFAKLVIGRHDARFMQIVTMVRHRDKAPSNALIAQAVRLCADRAIPYLVYSKFAYGNKTSNGLARFKRSNGFQCFELPRYYVPLTRVGQLVLHLRLHHDPASYLPGVALAQLRRSRALWSGWRLRAMQDRVRAMTLEHDPIGDA
jgi:hypothetical protein